MTAYVYILASRRNGTLYIGSTTDLARRRMDHFYELTPGFTSRYQVKILVYYEILPTLEEARVREQKLKHYLRKWKIELIEKFNPEWRDLFSEFQALAASRLDEELGTI